MPDAVRQAGRLAVEVTNSLRAELAELRGQSVADKDSILDLVRQIQLHIVQLTEGYVDQLAALTARCDEATAEGQSAIAQLQQVPMILGSSESKKVFFGKCLSTSGVCVYLQHTLKQFLALSEQT